MRDFTRDKLEARRPALDPEDAIEHVLEALYQDDTRAVSDHVVQGLSFEGMLGYLFAPISYLMGVPWEETRIVGNLLGQKIILNEFVAYVDFVSVKDTLSEHSQAVVTFALCGFANIASLPSQFTNSGRTRDERRRSEASQK